MLGKVRGLQEAEVILIAPFWLSKERFPDLLAILSEPPVRLPLRRDLLRQPHFSRFHLRLSMFQLHAWRDSSNLREPQGSLVERLEGGSGRGAIRS